MFFAGMFRKAPFTRKFYAPRRCVGLLLSLFLRNFSFRNCELAVTRNACQSSKQPHLDLFHSLTDSCFTRKLCGPQTRWGQWHMYMVMSFHHSRWGAELQANLPRRSLVVQIHEDEQEKASSPSYGLLVMVFTSLPDDGRGGY